MDNRSTNIQLQMRELFDRMLKRVNTCIPGVVQSFDPTTQTCTVTPAIQARTYIDGVSNDVTLPTLSQVPLIFPYDTVSGFAITLPVSAGSSCMLFFSQRCIDNWCQSGGVQPTEVGGVSCRHHDFNDAVAMLCGGPTPFALDEYNTSGIEIRNKDRSVRVTVTPTGLEFAGATIFNDPVTFKAAIIDANGVDHTTHLHGGVQGGSGDTGVPVA